MKKVIGLGVLLSMCLSLAACGGDSKKDDTAKNSDKTEETTKASSETKESSAAEPQGDFVKTANESSFDGTMLRGNAYSIRITDHKVIQPGEAGNEYGDNPVLAFWFDTLVSPDYDNSVKISPNTSWIMNFEAVQDNDPNMVNKLNVASLPDQAHLESQMAEIKPGGTVQSSMAYELTDTTTPVVLTAKSVLGQEFGSAEFTVN